MYIYIFIPHIQFLSVNYKSIVLYRGYINRAEDVQHLPIMYKTLGLIWSTKNYVT